MQEQHLFEYATIRVVPKVEREEFINVGVILFCNSQKYLASKISLLEPKVLAFAPQLAIHEIEANLKSFVSICLGEGQSGTIGSLTLAERFRWLTATRSTIIQCSKVHPGFCLNANDELEKLFEALVG